MESVKYRIKSMYGVLKITRHAGDFGRATIYSLDIPSLKGDSLNYINNEIVGREASVSYLAHRGLVKPDGTRIKSENPSGIETVLGVLEDLGWSIKRDPYNSMLKLTLKNSKYSENSDILPRTFSETTEYLVGTLSTSRCRLNAERVKKLRYELDLPSLNMHEISEDPSNIESALETLQNDKRWEIVSDIGDLLILKRKMTRLGQTRIAGNSSKRQV